MRLYSFGIFAITLLVLTLNLAMKWQEPQRQGIQNDSVDFMRAKLRHTQSIVEGLALENFASIAKNAQDLKLLSYESNWNVFQTPEYVTLSRDFRESADRLHKTGKAQNLDGATLAYFEVTLNCVRCHKYLRQKRHAPLDQSKKK